jgi:mRNA-degrading endonuclease toxin of MazEF toxin-antitoxin module
VLTDQLRVVDAQAVKGSVGHLTSGELAALDDALALVLGLPG